MRIVNQGSAAYYRKAWKGIWQNKALYLMVLPLLIYLGIFNYAPMYGVQIAFRDFNFADGIVDSKWVGLKWFQYFVKSPQFAKVIGNTLMLKLYGLLVGFPLPIILALMLHNVPSKKFSRTVQTVTYLPHFVSTVVLVGMMSCFFSPRSGFINTIITSLGGEATYFMGEAKYFRHLYVWSGSWSAAGWSSIIYLAQLSAVDPNLHEAAMIDGASKFRRIYHVELPVLAPIVVISLISALGKMLSLGFDKAYLMQNAANSSVSEIISTYVYKMGMINTRYSYSTAIDVFNSLINFVLLAVANNTARKVSGSSLW